MKLAHKATWIAILLSLTLSASAADLRLRQRAQISGNLVRLGDLADIASTDETEADTLAAMELFPAPPVGKTRQVALREIHEVLMLRGVGLAKHTFSGASRVSVESTAPEVAPQEPKLLPTKPGRLNPQVTASLVSYLVAQNPGSTPGEWRVKVDNSADLAQWVETTSAPLQVTGGEAPWTGTQQFMFGATDIDAYPLHASVERANSVVVAKRNIGRGDILSPLDVELRYHPRADKDEGIYNVEDVIGKEATRSIGAGQALVADCLRAPILVRRGEAVTVYARGPGLQVRTTARAQDDGSMGEAIAVEGFNNRQKFLARVCGPQEVEVLVGATVSVAAEPVLPTPRAEANSHGNRQAIRGASSPVRQASAMEPIQATRTPNARQPVSRSPSSRQAGPVSRQAVPMSRQAGEVSR